jgi:hypothetical protein
MEESRAEETDYSGCDSESASDTGEGEDYEHFYPGLKPGSDHESDNEWVDPPAYESEDDEVFPDNSLYANLNQDRINRPLTDWCSCGECEPMETEREHVCCNESHFITPHRGVHRCISNVGMFKELVVNKDGLMYSRYLYSLNIQDTDKSDKFLRKILKNKELRFLACKTFVNILSCQDLDRSVRYILPACVVTKIREQFPNPDGEPYTGYVSLKSKDAQSLP